MRDPIIEELWAIKEKIALEHDCDVDKLYRFIKEQEAKRGLPLVNREVERRVPAPELRAADNAS